MTDKLTHIFSWSKQKVHKNWEMEMSDDKVDKTRFTKDGTESIRVFSDGEAFKIYTDFEGKSTLGVQKPGEKHSDYASGGDGIDLNSI